MQWKQATQKEDLLRIPKEWVFLHYYEAFNLLFRIENALRVFVYVVLKNHLGKDWPNVQLSSDEADETTLATLAKRRLAQSQSFGYLGYPVTSPIVHLTSGELVRLITSDKFWPEFKRHFRGSRDIMRNKMDEIGTIRNALAHFRPIKIDDVDVLKQNSKHVLTGVEELLRATLQQDDTVPTNTAEDWYGALRTLGGVHCAFSFKQSTDEGWVRIELEYSCPVLRYSHSLEAYFNALLLSLKSPAILRHLDDIRELVTYAVEQVQYPRFTEKKEPKTAKTVAFVFQRSRLAKAFEQLKPSFEQLVSKIDTESDLIHQDNLARGQYVYSASIHANLAQSEHGKHWRWHTSPMLDPACHDDPPEYWGEAQMFGWRDFVARIDKYPWMTEAVSQKVFPWE